MKRPLILWSHFRCAWFPWLLPWLIASALLAKTPDEENGLPLSTPDQIATLQNREGCLVGGLISPLSGQLCLSQTDLIAPGAQEITLNRTHIAQSIRGCTPGKHDEDICLRYSDMGGTYRGWATLPQMRSQPSQPRFRITESWGATLDFHLVNGVTKLVSQPYGISNVSGETPSGQYDPRNTRIGYEPNGYLAVFSPTGVKRIYHLNTWPFYLLHKEILPNGRVLRYSYDRTGDLTLIESLDPQERYIYASLHVSGNQSKDRWEFVTNSGQTNIYHHETTRCVLKWHIRGGKRKSGSALAGILKKVESPFHQETMTCDFPFFLSSYQKNDQSFELEYGLFDHGLPNNCYRVTELSFETGQNLYTFSYDPAVAGRKGGTTTAKNCDGSSTIYHFSKNLLLEKQQLFGIQGDLRQERTYQWSDQQWLSSLIVKDGANQLLYQKDYQYDSMGNPIQELFKGELTGSGEIETCCTKRLFSDEGRHLLLREEQQNGKVTELTYLPNTNLMTSRITSDSTQVLKRESYLYDDCHNLVQKTIDSGLSRITHYRLRQEQPFLHMVEWIDEYYLEEGVEKLLSRRQLCYDAHGYVCQEHFFDANDQLAYTLQREYNDRGDLTLETNPIGQKATYVYDDKGHCLSSTDFSGVSKEMRYDVRGRLIETKQTGPDGLIHTTQYAYDANNRLIEEIDAFGCSTRYTYDPVVQQIAQTDFPPILIDGKSVPVITRSTYDALGRAICQTDSNGHQTVTRYNAYGSPTEILHPNGARERFRYDLQGRCIQHTDANGLTILYTYDVLDRLLTKHYLTDNQPIANETFVYEGLNLLSFTDKEGQTTHYTYDGAGRKIQEQTADQITSYTYDALGRLSTTCRHNGPNTLWIEEKRDLLDQLVELRKTDGAGNLLYQVAYTYDPAGNIQSVTRTIQGEEAKETFRYDSCNRLIETIDALGQVTKTHYDEQSVNPLGQRILTKTTLDPQGVSTLVTHDAHSRPVKEELVKGAQKLACREMVLDPSGNTLTHHEHVYLNGQAQCLLTTCFSYTPLHKVESITRAANTPNARTTRYTYTPTGKLASKIQPDGTCLFMTYDALGYRQSCVSSDDSVNLTYVHNRLGQLVQASDENQGFSIQRRLDPHGNVVSEQFLNGLVIEKTYDHLNRLLALSLPDQGRVEYGYDPTTLRTVTRYSPNGTPVYTHQYLEYDLSGHLIKEELPFRLGQVSHTYDKKGRKVAQMGNHYSQTCTYDEVDNLTQTTRDQIPSHYTYDGLSQLDSENEQHYLHDSCYNQVGNGWQVNELHELLSTDQAVCCYDLNGNLISKRTPEGTCQFRYDALNRLIEATTEKMCYRMIYDPLGRRLCKETFGKTASYWRLFDTEDWQLIDTENYLYDGNHEIAAYTAEGEAKQLRILGLSGPVPATLAIELAGKCYVPVVDCQGNICRLLDPIAKRIAERYDFSTFGLENNPTFLNPWRYASKRTDSGLNLVYYGQRYYDPQLARWLTTDPAGFIDGDNLYAYLFNNPFRYTDPDGRFVIALPLFIWGAAGVAWALPTITTIVTTVVVSTAVWYAADTSCRYLSRKLNQVQATHGAGEKEKKKKAGNYAPDRPLPQDEDGKPIPDTDAPHTQLGTKTGSKEKYVKAREFDDHGRPIRDIEFTDHGRPHDHLNPHQHRRKENKTGGTRTREPAEPLP